MPLIRAQLSTTVDESSRADLMKRLSETVAQTLGKPESYMQVVLESKIPMLMGGTPEPTALVEIRSVGTINNDQAVSLSAAVSDILSSTGIDAARIYTNCAGVPGPMWGRGGHTFG